MVLVAIIIQSLTDTFAHVLVALTVLDANWINDLVNQTSVGIMVYIFLQSLNRDKMFFIGTCNETSNTTFNCSCELGWGGKHCEIKVNHCENVTCENYGVCRPLFRDYSCECLGDSYSGQHCEITATRIKIYQMVSKSFAYVAIIAMISVVMFVIIMDILKYCFGIDPTRDDLERIRREKRAKKRKPVIQRFIYVNPPSPSEQPNATMTETVV
jgi:hypothetical protein